jgi:hypothetical protein
LGSKPLEVQTPKATTMISEEERALLMKRTCECTARSGCYEARRVQLTVKLLWELGDLQKSTPEIPLFEGEPGHCSLCGDAGHTHDDHWIFSEVERLGLRTCTRAERDILDLLEGIPPEAIGKYGASPGENWEPLRRAIRALREARGESVGVLVREDDLDSKVPGEHDVNEGR